MEGQPPDEVTLVLAHAARLVRRRPSDDDVDALLAALNGLDPLAFVRLDERSRSWSSGLGPGEIARLRSTRARGPQHRLWQVVGLLSADGHERERAARQAPICPSTLALLAIRATDWVTQVRAAALARLEHAPAAELLAILPLLDLLTRERSRGWALDAVVEARLGGDDLRAATGFDDPRARRAAWRRLLARAAHDVRDLRDRAATDPDVLVRAIAATLMPTLDEADRRAIAALLVGDRVGRIAGRALDVLIDLDGDAAIVDALTARNATLRRRARDWAAVRAIDARAIYRARLEGDPDDAAALVALAEIGDERDRHIVAAALADPRSRVRAAALQGLAAIDPPAAQEAAMTELARGGLAGRAAAKILRHSRIDDAHRHRLEAIALDTSQPPGRRMRALALMRQWRWPHLAAILQALSSATPPLDVALDRELNAWLWRSRHIARGPAAAQRQVIDNLLPRLDDARRRAIEFVLRTIA